MQADSVRYFFDNLERIAVRVIGVKLFFFLWVNMFLINCCMFQEYSPTNQDILHARKATKGVTEFVLTINSIPFHFVDVGGQRSQRQKWLQCFDSVTAILFLVSSSEYDQVILEDRYVIVTVTSSRSIHFFFYLKANKATGRVTEHFRDNLQLAIPDESCLHPISQQNRSAERKTPTALF